MAEIKTGMIGDVPEELRRLKYEIVKINRMFDLFSNPGESLEDLRVTHRHEAEMVELRRQVEVGSAPSPPLNQQTGYNRFPSEERSTLHRFLRLFYTWALLS